MIIGTLMGSVHLEFRNDHWDLPDSKVAGPERSLYAGNVLVGWVQGAVSDKFSAWVMTSSMGHMIGLFETEAEAQQALVSAVTVELIS